MQETVGFIGLGAMGSPMARNLLQAGYTLRVYNRDARKAEPLVQEGAQRVERPADVAERGGIVITMLSNDEALESVTTGTDGFLDNLGEGGVHISMSTVSPTISHVLAQKHAQHQSAYLAAPVFGRPDAAAARKLWICLAGESQAKQRVQPILQAMGQQIFDFGEEPEKANIVKICGNFMIGAAQEAIAEALTLGEKYGIDRSAMQDMYASTLFACSIYQGYGKRIAERSFTPVGFQLGLALKDVNLALDAAEQSHMPMPLASLLHDRMLRAVARGQAQEDWTAMTGLFSEGVGG